MAKEKLSEEKSAAIKEMIRLYDIKSAKDFEEAFKDMFGPVLQSMLEGELDAHLGYAKYERNGGSNSRNGHSKKTVETSAGEIELEIPRDREGTFEPQAVILISSRSALPVIGRLQFTLQGKSRG